MIIKQKISLLGINIDNIPKKELLENIKEIIHANQKGIISYANLHSLNLCFEIPWFRNFTNNSQIVFCDGFGVHVGARFTNQRVNFRLTLPDCINSLCQLANENNWSLFFLGAKPGISELAADKLRSFYPGLNIDTYHGYFMKESEENQHVINLVNQSSAQILIVGMGMPLQEKWIRDNFEKLFYVQVVIPAGALFDYVAEVIPRGPKFLTNHGFEWLTRLIIEPKRLWKRYVIGIPLALYRILKYYYDHGNENI